MLENLTIRVRTETGSLYVIDPIAKTWERREEPRFTGDFPLRSITGGFKTVGRIQEGESISMVCPKWPTSPTDERYITTSYVVEVKVFDGDAEVAGQ